MSHRQDEIVRPSRESTPVKTPNVDMPVRRGQQPWQRSGPDEFYGVVDDDYRERVATTDRGKFTLETKQGGKVGFEGEGPRSLLNFMPPDLYLRPPPPEPSKDLWPRIRDCEAAFDNMVRTSRAVWIEYVDTHTETETHADALSWMTEKLEDDAGRFRVWQMEVGRASIDLRTRDFPQLRLSIHWNLDNLEYALKRLVQIVPGKTHNYVAELASIPKEMLNVPGGHLTTEGEEAMKQIKSSVSHLFKLSTLICEPVPRGRYVRPNESLSPSADIVWVWDSFKKAQSQPWLIQKLGLAITDKREYVRYRSRSKGEKKEMDYRQEVYTMPSRRDSDSSVDEQEDSDSASIATSFDSNYDEAEDGRIRVPNPPAASAQGTRFEYGEPFDCPYCCTRQIVKDRHEWKRHVFTDLRPYTCTFEGCTVPDFAYRHEWFEHELARHRKDWHCASCDYPPFQTREYLVSHYKSDHPEVMTEAQLEVVLPILCKPTKFIDKSGCPLCEKWRPPPSPAENLQQFRKHLGDHLEMTALRSLSKSSESEDFVESQPDGPTEEQSTRGSQPTTNRPGWLMLAIDDGGVRSFASLLVLERIIALASGNMSHSPYEIFDFICGTGTGGVLSTMLGNLRMTVSQCIQHYETFARSAYPYQNADPWTLDARDRRFSPELLNESVREVLRRRGLLEEMFESDQESTTIVMHDTSMGISNSRASDEKLWKVLRRSTYDRGTFDGPMSTVSPESGLYSLDSPWTAAQSIATMVDEASSSWTKPRGPSHLISIGTHSPGDTEWTRPTDPRATYLPNSGALDAALGLLEHDQITFLRMHISGNLEKIPFDAWNLRHLVFALTRRFMERPDIKDHMQDLATKLARNFEQRVALEGYRTSKGKGKLPQPL